MLARIESCLRESPAKWTGIALGAGLGLGLLGRLVRSRMYKQPDMVVIETLF